MYEVTAWNNGVQKTMPDHFDDLELAIMYANGIVNYKLFGRFQYDEAHVALTDTGEVLEVVRREN